MPSGSSSSKLGRKETKGKSVSIRSQKHSPSELIGALIKRARLEQGLTRAEVARYLGDQNEDTLALYESGRKSIPVCDIYALANCLNISPRLIQKLIEHACI